ncbi:MAG TPA: bifunctional UDP-sugar hydrolase/5'-nucleotidase [Syntrophomonadaceae bacterium]|nr:bifunctional UDP-sugar hydrolase/5'-nucleotidase [Syntrophomonadaceae bacterium]HPU49307.1 bifunctional UDP-sugar hydrolase/5'-nucleotidase [Syntrophomonadaceae bacterium]
MKKRAGFLALLLISAVLLAGFPLGIADAEQEALTILFTHDMHDNLLPYTVEENEQIVEQGGYARLQTVINQERVKDPDLILVDGGDFSMGTLFQTIFSQDAPELRMLGQMGYDATTFGNHEFDFRPEGLAGSLLAAKASGERLPQLVAANLVFPQDDQGNIIGEDLQVLQKAMQEYGVKDYIVIDRKGYKIGIFGIIGKNAVSNAPMAGVEFIDPVKAAREAVDKLEKQEKVDMIICLSHSGTHVDPKKSEDEILAKEVPEIDVIISGHTHTTLNQPIVVGDTYICSAGHYGKNLGKITIANESPGTWSLENYQLLPINKDIADDEILAQRIEEFKAAVQGKYLKPMNLGFDNVLAYTPFSFTPASDLEDVHDEQPLANLIGDAYIYAIKQAEGDSYEPVDVAVVPAGTIRASFVKGNITVSDAFNVSSLGIGPDKRSGYPLLTVYLTGEELKTVCEVDASIAPIMRPAQLYLSGLTYTFNPHRMIFNKVTDVALLRPDGSREEIQDDKLYRVAAGLYSAQMLSVVGEKSFGLLSLVPKTKEGDPITDFEAHIIRDANNNEVKEWWALASYLQSFEKVNGIPQVPEYYSQKQGRKIVNDDPSLMARLAHPNGIALAIYGIIIVILLLLVLGIRAIVVRRRRAIEPSEPI